MGSKSCINCQTVLQGEFCHVCGQKNERIKLTLKTVLREFTDKVFGFDTKFGRSLKQLTINPGKVPKAYVEGNRSRYMGPVAYYFLLLTIFVLLTSKLEIDMSQFTKMTTEFTGNEEQSQRQMDFARDAQNIFFDNFRIVSFLLIPFFTLGQIIFFRKSGYNFVEHSVVTFYGQAHPTILSILAAFVYYFISEDFGIQSIILLIGIVYMGLMSATFYNGNKVWNFFKGMFSMIVGLTFFMIFVMLLALAIILVNPNFVKG